MRYLILMTLLFLSCSSDDASNIDPDKDPDSFIRGADLSYVNEMEDCGAEYFNNDGNQQDPYKIFSDAGTNLVRLRLWHSPGWTEYSNLNDVKKSIRRAKDFGMQVLLDFHYSDTWADPSKQEIPAAWAEHTDNLAVLKDSIYNYTYSTLEKLAGAGLLPEIVQVGNEINPMILQQGNLEWPINWDRNSQLINSGIKAVRDVAEEQDKDIQVMLHIAQPENAVWWFEQATENGVNDFDWIGLSYYPIWSEYDLNEVGPILEDLIQTYDKKLMIVETAYPFTMENADAANNILGSDALVAGYPATQQGQLNYLNKLEEVVKSAGGEGIVYWEPTWVSTDCNTLWGQGSHWDNATLFDHNNKATKGMNFYSGAD